MSENIKNHRRLIAFIAPIAAVMFAASGLAVAQAASTTVGSGPMEFGKTSGFFKAHTKEFTYAHGYWCDTKVASTASTGCEVGAKWTVAPSKQHDPLFITVPLGFTVPMSKMDCPDKLICVDHPDTLDLTRLAPALAPIFKTTPEKLTPALQNFVTPGHDHFVTDLNNGKAEWWDVYVVGVTNQATYNAIHKSRDYRYIQKLLKAKNPHVVGPIPTNLFLNFKVS
jgi:hypothetical protein